MFSRALAYASLALVAAGMSQDRKAKGGPAPAADGIAWVHSWEDALKEAECRKAPIHVAVHQDG
jgi:hypothetical protein